MSKSAKKRQDKKSMKQRVPLSWKKYSIIEEQLNSDDNHNNQYEDYLEFLTKQVSWYRNKNNISNEIITFLDRCKTAKLSVKEFKKLFEDEFFIHIIEGIISAGRDKNFYYTYRGQCLYLQHKLNEKIIGNYPLLGSGMEEELIISPEVFDTFFADCYKYVYVSSWKLSLLEQIIAKRQTR